MNKLTVAAMITLLAGCAATPKPMFPDSAYAEVVRDWGAFAQCAEEGMMPTDIAAQGRRYLQEYISDYTMKTQRYEEEANKLRTARYRLTYAQCKSLEMKVLGVKQRLEENASTIAANQRATQELINQTRVVNTYCNRFDNQIFCNRW